MLQTDGGQRDRRVCHRSRRDPQAHIRRRRRRRWKASGQIGQLRDGPLRRIATAETRSRPGRSPTNSSSRKPDPASRESWIRPGPPAETSNARQPCGAARLGPVILPGRRLSRGRQRRARSEAATRQPRGERIRHRDKRSFPGSPGHWPFLRGDYIAERTPSIGAVTAPSSLRAPRLVRCRDFPDAMAPRERSRRSQAAPYSGCGRITPTCGVAALDA